MPCNGGPVDSEYQLRREFDRVTRLLCEACRILDATQRLGSAPDLAAWWAEHQRADRERSDRNAKRLRRDQLTRLSFSSLVREATRKLGGPAGVADIVGVSTPTVVRWGAAESVPFDTLRNVVAPLLIDQIMKVDA